MRCFLPKYTIFQRHITQWSHYTNYFDDILGPPTSYTCRSLFGPVPLNLRPYLGNGFVATQPGSPWIFLDGFFDGYTTESHRACIPSPLCWSAKIQSYSDVSSSTTSCLSETNWMHFGMGVYSHRICYQGVEVETSTFVSRSRPGVLIRFVEAFFSEQTSTDQILVLPDSAVDFSTPDCEIVTTRISNGIAMIGSTRIAECDHFQSETSRFYIFTNVVPDTLSNGFVLTPKDRYRFFLVCVSRKSISDSVEQYNSACTICREEPDQMFEEQATAWSRLWHDGGIYLLTADPSEDTLNQSNSFSHNKKVNKFVTRLPLIVNVSQYSLLTCLPTHLSDWTESCEFFGLCPTGLARGNEEDDYMGHVFWDMEMWMLPWINLFHTEQCRLALDYRYFMLPAARYLALLEDHEGARYPWESAFTGVETTPWILAAENQIHNTAGVSFAVQNWLLTNMPDSICPSFSVPKIESHAGSALKADHKQAERWFTERGLILLEEIARFWNSRMHFNEEKEAFEILHVMPPDEYTHCCRNSAYTNAIASLALAAPATFARRQAHPIKPEYLEWETRASRLWIPRDQAHQLMLEHEDYVLGTCVKQADTVLLTYPLQFDQPELWKRNMIDYYAGVTDPNGPAMTWSIFCICALELKDYERATDYFKRCLLHVKGPFLSWTETRDGSGAANFLTGAGGFLQTLVHGYCGLRMQLIEHHLVKPDCPDPTHRVTVLKLTPPIVGIPDHENMILWMRGLAFQGRRLHLKFNWSRCLIEIQLVAGSPLCLGSFSESGWVFDTVLLVGDAPIGRGGQSLCIVSQSALGGISVDNSLNSPCRLD